MLAFVWMWGLFLVTLLGDYGASSYTNVGWFWLLLVFFFVIALFLTLDAHKRGTQ
jgi:hypothetical protein